MHVQLNALIVEDEPKASYLLRSFIESHVNTYVRVIGEARTVAEAVNMIRTKSPDVVFMDIHLGKENAFEVFQFLPTFTFDIIFTTAYADYAVDAFDLGASHYLVKPIHPKKLTRAVEKVYKNRVRESRYIIVPTAQGVTKVYWNQVVYLQAEKPYVKLFLVNGAKMLVDQSLKALITEMPSHFIQVHRAYAVNLQYVFGVDKQAMEVHTLTGLSVPVSNRRLAALRDVLT